jgi:photosystem II stability/assembly factor-like uncharacterized protein
LIEERQVFDRFHEALDVEPRPGAFDRLQAALAKSPVTSQRRRWTMLPMRRTKLRLAAGLLVVVLIVAVVASFLAAHPPTGRVTPAKPSGSDGRPVLPQMMAGQVGWACCPLHTTDGGLHWQDVTPPALPDQTKGGNATYFLDANHAWTTVATGPGTGPLATHLVVFATADGGRTWNQGVPVPASGAGSVSDSLDFIDAQHGWLLIDSGVYGVDKTNTSIIAQPRIRSIYSTTDGGLNWSLLVRANEADGSTLGGLALGCSISGLTFVTLDRGWLTWDCNSLNGPATIQQSPRVVAATQDGGRSWQPVELPSYPSASDWMCSAFPPVFTLSQAVLPMYCGGTGHPGWTAVYATDDGGHSWSFLKLPVFSQQVDFVDANTGWASSGAGGLDLYRTTNRGRDWAVVKRFASEQGLYSVKFVDTQTGFALTLRTSADQSFTYTTMWKSTDGGQTWSLMSSVRTVGPPI